MKTKLLSITVALVLSISASSQTTVCFSTPDGIDNTWTGGWSYKEYVIPNGFKIDSVNMGATRPGYPTSQEDFIFSSCAGTTTYDVNTSTTPFNYTTDNNSEYNHWINLTSFNYSSIGVVRVFLPVNAGALWNNLCFAISPVCSVDLSTGLVAQYNFSGNANDGSGNNLNGTITGASLTADRFGNPNSAYSFNGTSNYIDVLNNSSLNFSNNISFTISAWIKLSGSNVNYSGIVTKMDNSGNGYQFVVGNNTVLNKLATEFGQGGTGVSFAGNQNLNDGNWHNVIYIADRVANTISFYVDNILDIQTTNANVSAANIDNTVNLKIGVDRTMTDYFKGSMDDIKIYNKALRTCDIDSLFNIPNCTGVTASISANGPVTFCQGGNVILTATTATSYLWSNNATTQSITVSTAGANSVTTINSSGCPATSATTTVTVNSKPTVITNNPSAVCSPATVNITLPAVTTGSTGGLTFTYFTNAGATTPYLTPTAATNGTYFIVGTTGNSCSDTTALTITTNPKPTVVTVNPTAVCSPATVDITLPAVTTGSTGGLTYTYFADAGATIPYLTPTATTNGVYYIAGASGAGCSDTTAVTVTVNPLPTVSFNTIPNFVNINATPIALTGTPTGGTFTGNGVSSNSFSPTIAGLGTKQITYNYTNGNSCSNSSVTSTIVYDTTGTLCTSYDTVYTSVTDTLVINAVLTGINPPNNINAVKIYPNPASTHITIDNGNYNLMAGYYLTIENNLGQTVFTSLINQQQFFIDLSTWSGNGIYFVHIIDAQSNTIEIKKIVLQ